MPHFKWFCIWNKLVITKSSFLKSLLLQSLFWNLIKIASKVFAVFSTQFKSSLIVLKTDFQQFRDSTQKMETVIARINDQSPINHEIKKVKVSLIANFTSTYSATNCSSLDPVRFRPCHVPTIPDSGLPSSNVGHVGGRPKFLKSEIMIEFFYSERNKRIGESFTQRRKNRWNCSVD